MTHFGANPGEHQRYGELAAAATCGTITAEEREALESHLQVCEECRTIFREYQILTNEGFALLAPGYEHREESGRWNEAAARRRLLASAEEPEEVSSRIASPPAHRFLRRRVTWAAALAACFLVCLLLGTWRLGNLQGRSTKLPEVSLNNRVVELLSAEKSTEATLAVQADDLTRLQADSSAKRHAFEQLQSRFQELQKRSQEERTAAQTGMESLSQAKAGAEARVTQVSQERDRLSEQLRSALQAYDLVQADLANLRAERDKVRLQLASVETKLSELTALGEEQERRLKDNEQYLSSDRDIRDLMSARNLYIADVFDVDSHSHTRKAFGRVFFTRGKSLLFYAFDLDEQSQIKNASTFQVWGEKETAQSEQARPVDLGILYLDSEANRRWFLRFDNSQTLSQIDAVFVTVEPHGGSRKPTGKPFLFATLRKEANHP